MLEMMTAVGKPPATVGNVAKMIIDGNIRMFALHKDGSFYCRGQDSGQGILGNNEVNSVGKWTKILTNVKDFWVSQQFVLMMTNDGRWFWFGRFLDTTVTAVLVPTEITANFTSLVAPVKKVVSCPYGIAILDTLGNVYTKGYNANGWLFTGNTTTHHINLTLRSETNVRDIEVCSASPSLYIQYNDGSIKGSGDGSAGQLGPTVTSQTTLRLIAGTSGTARLVAGASCLWVLSGASWFVLGQNQGGQTGLGSTTGFVTVLTNVPAINGASIIVAGSYRTWALVGLNWYFTGQQPNASGTTTISTSPWTATMSTFAQIPVGTFPILDTPVIGPASANNQSLFLHSGKVYGTGDATTNKQLPGFGTQVLLGYRELNMDFTLVE